MDSATLTFSMLNARVDALPSHESMTIAPKRREVWGYLVGFGAWFISMIVVRVLPETMTKLVVAATLLIIEVVALAIAVIPQKPWRLPSFVSERNEFAEQLDFDQRQYDELTQWLSTFPKKQLDAMAEYANRRHEQLKDKYPLISGGLEKLGALPIMAALFLQFKDFQWPQHVTWLEFILGIALVSLYWGSLLLASLRFRVQLFGILLTRAAQLASEPEPSDAMGERMLLREIATA